MRDFEFPLSLEQVYDHEEYDEVGAYDLDNFDANSGKMVKELKSIKGVEFVGFLDLNSVYVINDSSNFIRELDKKVNSLKSFGTSALFYLEGELCAVVFIEDWNIDCVPKRIKQKGAENSYARNESKKLIQKLNSSLPGENWAEFYAEHSNVYGGIYGQTRFVSLRRSYINSN